MQRLIYILLVFLVSCVENPAQDSTRSTAHKKAIASPENDMQRAFDALNQIQMSESEDRFYSTFPGVALDRFTQRLPGAIELMSPADTTFIISQSELAVCIEGFLLKYSHLTDSDERVELAELASSAQESYQVFLFGDPSLADVAHAIPRTGTWVMPYVGNQRDVVLVW
jgi:hypothetical protein